MIYRVTIKRQDKIEKILLQAENENIARGIIYDLTDMKDRKVSIEKAGINYKWGYQE